MGYSRGVDSVQETKIRAKACAKLLISEAYKGPVLLVGHGYMNHLIAKELLVLGWIRRSKHENTYWGTSIYGLPSEL